MTGWLKEMHRQICRYMLENEDLVLPVTSFLTNSIAGLDLNVHADRYVV